MLDKTILDQLNRCAEALESRLDSDVISYHGPLHHSLIKDFRNFIEEIAEGDNKKPRLSIFIKTLGGVVEPVEKMVEIIRQHYEEVYFFVPDSAMSAGTIFCMSGDRIYMDYTSSLGPIDPQVLVNNDGNGRYVPALGYLEQVDRLILKSKDGTLTPAEFALLQGQDLALLSSYEQARDLSIELLKAWLVKYKFRSWTHHRSDPNKKGTIVTDEEKECRAVEIAKLLGNHQFWHSHGRMIGAEKLRSIVKLEIDDYTNDRDLKLLVRAYNDILTDYIDRQRYVCYFHNRRKTSTQ
ncbi:Serine dehydrogenase proteinase [uncultured Gammaproteobacteria bacterium]